MPIVTMYPSRAVATASRTAAANAASSRTTWSAANEPTTAPGRRRSTTAAASAIAAVESRGDGSASRQAAPRPGSCSVTAAACAAPVTTRAPCGPVSGSSRSRVCWSRLRPLPVRSSRNFGCPARESGHSRVPAPPAGTIATKSGRGGLTRHTVAVAACGERRSRNRHPVTSRPQKPPRRRACDAVEARLRHTSPSTGGPLLHPELKCTCRTSPSGAARPARLDPRGPAPRRGRLHLFPARRVPVVAKAPAGTLYRGREGMWSWVAHRITGVLIFFFLLVHVLDTALVRVSPETYNAVIGTYKNPIVGLGEAGLVGAVVFHALNGVRVMLVDFWHRGTRLQRQMLWGVVALWVVLMVPFLVRHLSNVFGA